MKSVLVKGTKITFKIDRELIKDKTPKSEEFYFPNGIIDYAKKNYDKNEKIISKFFYKELKINEIETFEAYVSFNKDNKSSLSSFCNTVETPDGGSHENALKNALLQSIKIFGKIPIIITAKAKGTSIIFSLKLF